jgi:hypothetical protein
MGRAVLNPDVLAVSDLPGVSVELDTDLLTTDRRFARSAWTALPDRTRRIVGLA